MARLVVRRLDLTVRAVMVRLAAIALLDRRPLPAVLSALTPRSRLTAPRDVAEQVASSVERAFERVALLPDTCLYRALARYAVLRRAGHAARFVMGLDPRSPDIVGHAWVELDGEPVGETLAPGLTITFAYPPARSS